MATRQRGPHLPMRPNAVPPALPRGVAGGARCALLRRVSRHGELSVAKMSASGAGVHWKTKESSKSALAEALEKAQRPRLAAGHEFIGRRLLRFRRGGGDSKEKTSGRVRAVRDDPGRGRLFAVLWDDRPGVTEEARASAYSLTRGEVAAHATSEGSSAECKADAARRAPASQLTRDELDVYLCVPQPPQPPAPPPPPPPGLVSPPQPEPAAWGSPVPIAYALPPGVPLKPPPKTPAPPPPPAAPLPASESSPEVLFVGVRHEKSGKWRAEIRLPQENAAAGEGPKRGKMKCLGSFDTAAEAAAAYDAAARLAGRTAVNVPNQPGETQAVKPRKRERPPQKPPQPAAASPGGFPALDAQRRALAAASAQAASRPAAPPADAAVPPAKLQRVAVAVASSPPAAAAVSAPPAAAQRAAPPGEDELGEALARHGLGGLAPRFAAERIDAALLRAAGSDLLRGREAQERLGVTTLGDAMRLGLVLKALGVMWDGA